MGSTEHLLSIHTGTEKSKDLINAEQDAKQLTKAAAKAKHKNIDIGCLEFGEVSYHKNTVVNSNQVKLIKALLKPSEGNETQKLKSEVRSTVVFDNNIGVLANNMIQDKDSRIDSRTKSELKSERRAKQEAQRAAKAGKLLKVTQQSESLINPCSKQPKIQEKVKFQKQEILIDNKQHGVKLFNHLYIKKRSGNLEISVNSVHPSIVRLGAQYSSHVVTGSNARCVALLHVLREIIRDYVTPIEKEFSRGLESQLNLSMNYLSQFRPLAVSMTNALRHLKWHLTQLPNNISDEEARRKLNDTIDLYIREQIEVAGEAICNSVQQKISNGDVILIYGCSSLVYRILVESHQSGTKFRVVVVDGGPLKEGKEMLRRLVQQGLQCTYILITATSFIMREVSKVLLGAHGLLANGYVMSRAGSSLVALLAKSFNVPVLVCCETYKFCERVQTDAFVCNELGNSDELAGTNEEKIEWKNNPNLVALNLVYDVTPPDLVTAVVTELAILPCTSVPVILRIKPSELTPI